MKVENPTMGPHPPGKIARKIAIGIFSRRTMEPVMKLAGKGARSFSTFLSLQWTQHGWNMMKPFWKAGNGLKQHRTQMTRLVANVTNSSTFSGMMTHHILLAWKTTCKSPEHGALKPPVPAESHGLNPIIHIIRRCFLPWAMGVCMTIAPKKKSCKAHGDIAVLRLSYPVQFQQFGGGDMRRQIDETTPPWQLLAIAWQNHENTEMLQQLLRLGWGEK